MGRKTRVVAYARFSCDKQRDMDIAKKSGVTADALDGEAV